MEKFTPPQESATHPPFLICPASIGMTEEAPASELSIAYSESDMVAVKGVGEKVWLKDESV